MMRIAHTQGRFDASLTTVATDVRKPVFVDNAVHYAKIESRSDGKNRVTIEARNAENYDIATEKAYSMVESESAVTLTHRETDGHSLKSTIWTTKGQNSTIPLLYSENDPSKRIRGDTSSTTSTGVRVELRNMKGRTLDGIGFSDDTVHFGQLLDVGFRTSDLVMKIADDATGTLTAVSIGDSMTNPNSTHRRKHSNSFLATDFNNVNLITAMRYIARHDNGIPMYDRFGVLMYVPLNYFSKVKVMDDTERFGNKNSNPVDNADNRVAVQGRQIALNENLTVTMDDREKQQGKNDHYVVETITPTFDASITSNQQARKVARKMLKASNLLAGQITTNGHPHKWDLRPGDIVYYAGERKMIVRASHSMLNAVSNFTFLSQDAGLDGILQGILEGGVTESSTTNSDKTGQITEENFSFFSDMEVRTIPIINVRYVSAGGYLIGRNANRGQIGGAHKTIGLNKDPIITMRGEM